MARLDVERSPRNEENDDAFMELFNDKDATFEDMVGAMREDDASGQEHQPSRRDAQSSLPQEMLGIDEEVKIKKVRKPVVKLDETRQVFLEQPRPFSHVLILTRSFSVSHPLPASLNYRELLRQR
jgi:hypothetical protein